MDAARMLTPPMRAATYETLIGLIAATGLRLGEALGLDRTDVDLEDGVLHVRRAKQNKQREVPLHPARPRRYASTRACATAAGPRSRRPRSSFPGWAFGSPHRRSTTRSRS